MIKVHIQHMTVRDLIIALKHCPMDAEIQFDDDDYDKPSWAKGYWPTIEYCTWRRDGEKEIVRLSEHKK